MFFFLSLQMQTFGAADKNPTHSTLFIWAHLGRIRGIDRTLRPHPRSFNFHAVVFSGAPLSQPHSRGRPDERPSSRGHRRCPSHAAAADQRAQRRVLRGVITSLQLLHPTFFAALRPTNQIFHVSWHAPSTHK